MALDDDAQVDPATLPENIRLMQDTESVTSDDYEPVLDAPARGEMRELMVEALKLTTGKLVAALERRHGKGPREADLRDGLADALSRTNAAILTEGRLRMPGWTPNLGGFDVVVAGADGSVVLVETKWGEVWQAIWDILKLPTEPSTRE